MAMQRLCSFIRAHIHAHTWAFITCLSTYLLCNTLYQKFNQWRKTAAIHPALENKEIFRLFLSSCKSMRHTGHSRQLFWPWGLLQGKLQFTGDTVITCQLGKKHPFSILPSHASSIRLYQSARTRRACFNENCLPSLHQLGLLMSNWQNGFLLGGRSPDPLLKTSVEKWHLGWNSGLW